MDKKIKIRANPREFAGQPLPNLRKPAQSATSAFYPIPMWDVDAKHRVSTA